MFILRQQLGAQVAERARLLLGKLFFDGSLVYLHAKMLHFERPIKQCLKDDHVLLAIRLAWRRASTLDKMDSDTVLVLHGLLVARVLTINSRLLFG